MVSLIVAVDEQGGIGKQNTIPWYYSNDLKYFKQLTLNNTIIMGRNTWDSLPIKPLHNRKHIVLSSKDLGLGDYDDDNVIVYNKFYDVVEYILNNKHKEKIFIVGGARMYTDLIDLCDTLYITRIPGVHDCDVHVDIKSWDNRFYVVSSVETEGLRFEVLSNKTKTKE